MEDAGKAEEVGKYTRWQEREGGMALCPATWSVALHEQGRTGGSTYGHTCPGGGAWRNR